MPISLRQNRPIGLRIAPVLLYVLLAGMIGCNSEPATPTTPETGTPAAEDPAPAAGAATQGHSAAASPQPADASPTIAQSGDAAKPAESPQFQPPMAAPDAAPAGSPAGAETAQAAPQQPVNPGEDPLVPKGANRDNTAGWWQIVFSVNGEDHNAGFIKLDPSKKGTEAADLRKNGVFGPAELAEVNLTDKTLGLSFRYGDQKFDFQGALAENVIRGNLQFGGSPRQILVRLVPIEQSAVTDENLAKDSLGATFGQEAILNALEGESPAKSMQSLKDTYKRSPVLYMGYDILFQRAQELKIPQAELEQAAKDYLDIAQLWGDRAVSAARITMAVDLMSNSYATDLAEQQLETARKNSPDLIEDWKELIDFAQRTAKIGQAQQLIAEGKAKEGLTILQDLHKQDPSDPLVTYRLAQAEAAHGEAKTALNLFGRLAALPQSEMMLQAMGVAGQPDYKSPRQMVEDLWKSQGEQGNVEEYLNKVYSENVVGFLSADQKNRPTIEGKRTVLLELLTGAMCPPCVAADIASEAVEKSFKEEDVVVLRYHVHVPGPDPLANTDSLARLSFYQAQGTPTVLIDGQDPEFGVGGSYQSAPAIYKSMADAVAAAAAETPQAEIKLSAKVEGNVLKIDAQATPSSPSDALRLRLAVAESHVEFPARNGIRMHDMVVREMPGGAAGVAPVDGKFSYQQEIPLAELRDRQLAYLDEFEKKLAEDYNQTFRFSERPISYKRLTVVAFVQDDRNRQVLQAVAVPIEQEITLAPPSEAKAQASAKEQPKTPAELPDIRPAEKTGDSDTPAAPPTESPESDGNAGTEK